MSTSTSSDILTNLSHLLPTGTFFVFQALAPIFTNNGECRTPEKIVTGILLTFFFSLCFVLSFVDSVTTEHGKVYYGVVTPKGLYNHQFRKSKIPGDLMQGDEYFTGGDENNDYKLKLNDFMNGLLNVITFAALTCLTPPITTCYYPKISPTIVRTGPILAGMLVGVLFGLFPSGRHGVGFALTTSGFGFVPIETTPSSSTAPNTDGSSSAKLLTSTSDIAMDVLDVSAKKDKGASGV